MRRIRDFFLSIKLGMPVKELGVCDEVVIRYKDKLISILESEDGEIQSLGWFYDTELHTPIPIKDFWEAKPPHKKTGPQRTR